MSSSVTEKMKALFPSTSFSGGTKRSDFDPTKESDVMVNKKKKRKQFILSQLPLMSWLLGGSQTLNQGEYTRIKL